MKVGDLVHIQYVGCKPQKSICIIVNILFDRAADEIANILTPTGIMLTLFTRDLRRIYDTN